MPGTLGRAGGDRGAGRAHRGVPAGAVRAVRDDDLPGLQRPDHHVRRPGDLVAAALPALRPGPQAPAAVAGSGAEVLPARVRCPRPSSSTARRCSTATRAPSRCRRSTTALAHQHPAASVCCSPAWACSASGCCSSSVPCRSTPGRRTSTPGAPTPVTGFMAACTKIAAIGALMRVFYVGLGGDRWDWQPLMAIVAVATMAVGSVLAITQTDVKRMLAYSSIAHAGFIMTAFVGASQAATGAPAGALTSVSSVMFYLVAYGAATIGAFAMVTMVRDTSGEATAADQLGRAGAALAAGRRGLLAVHAELRRHPADQRLHRQVGGVRGGLERRRALARRGRRGDQRDRGVLLHPGHRVDVLLRAERRRYRRSSGPAGPRWPRSELEWSLRWPSESSPDRCWTLAQQAGEFIR